VRKPHVLAEHDDYGTDTALLEELDSLARLAEHWRKREAAAAERVSALAAALAQAEEDRERAQAASRTHLASLAAVVREKEALDARLKAESERADDATAAAKSIRMAGEAAVDKLRGEVAAAVGQYHAEHAALRAENDDMRALLVRLTTLAEEEKAQPKEDGSLSRTFTLRRRKKPLEALADEGALPASVSIALLVHQKERMETELHTAKKERSAAVAHVRGAEEAEGLRALEAVGEVARAVRGRVQACGDCRPAVLDAVARAEEEVGRKYERGVVQR
jgi:hypothetical protein